MWKWCHIGNQENNLSFIQKVSIQSFEFPFNEKHLLSNHYIQKRWTRIWGYSGE